MRTVMSFLCVGLFFLTGCSSGGIVGKWKAEAGTYEFHADGTYGDPRYPRLPRTHTKYKLEGDKLHLSVREVFLNGESTTSQEWTVKFLDRDTLDVEGEAWKRVR